MQGRPGDGGGGGLGLNGGQLIYWRSPAGVSNHLFREALADGIELTSVRDPNSLRGSTEVKLSKRRSGH